MNFSLLWRLHKTIYTLDFSLFPLYAPYRGYSCAHAYCNVRLLRELRFLAEVRKHPLGSRTPSASPGSMAYHHKIERQLHGFCSTVRRYSANILDALIDILVGKPFHFACPET
jgi:hypothetical protein